MHRLIMTSETYQQSELDFLASINRPHADSKPGDGNLEARIQSYELAYRMQSEAPEAVDLSSESEATRKLYGMDDEMTAKFGGTA